ncbi:MAG: hypothetical protein DRN71_03645 [Candidatus Nanohalarchaeota archaeon]|nr:MAG: hypothetical protein DRN71_03645 [Candidatus Nanohaloarchaeota archaeon]
MAGKIYERKLDEKIKKFVKRKEIVGIRGARQTGKTTLLKIIANSIPDEYDKVFVNMDMVEYRRALEESPMDFVKRFRTPDKKLYLFLDEVQRVKDGGEKLKIIFDEFPDVKMFISGSSSLELKANILGFLVGRLFLYELYTFDFEEFLSTRDKGLVRLFAEKHLSFKNFLEDEGDIDSPAFTSEFLSLWKEYVIFGGYPEVVKAPDYEEKIAVLKNIFNLYLEKDIIAFFGIEDTSNFEKLLKVLAFNISSLMSGYSIASDLGIPYKKVEVFLTILEHTYSIHLLKPFHRNLVTELKKSSKIYFLDTGLRNMAIDNFTAFGRRSDQGELMENFVLRELVSGFGEWKLNYWRTAGKAEMDFVLRKGNKIIPIEVKLGGEKLGKSFYSFLEAYEPKKAVVASLDKFKKEKIGKTMVYWVPVFYL